MQKLDILFFSAHPDDTELGCAGTILKLIQAGKTVGVIDLTRGELGSRGSAEIRADEAREASRRMGLQVRDNLGFRDGFFIHDETHQLAIIKAIRRYQPDVLITNAPSDRHPDHGRASKLVRDATFYSGLRKIETQLDGQAQEAWRPKRTFFFIQDYSLTPDFVVDISPYFEQKMEVIRAFGSQFYNPEYNSEEPTTYISNQDFWHFLEARARNMGHMIGVSFGEGYLSESPLAVDSFLDLL